VWGFGGADDLEPAVVFVGAIFALYKNHVYHKEKSTTSETLEHPSQLTLTKLRHPISIHLQNANLKYRLFPFIVTLLLMFVLILITITVLPILIKGVFGYIPIKSQQDYPDYISKISIASFVLLVLFLILTVYREFILYLRTFYLEIKLEICVHCVTVKYTWPWVTLYSDYVYEYIDWIYITEDSFRIYYRGRIDKISLIKIAEPKDLKALLDDSLGLPEDIVETE
jgi:hypothetical protein